MKLAELKAETEYALRKYGIKIKLTEKQLAQGPNKYNKKIEVMEWWKPWGDEERIWVKTEVTLAEIAMTWEEHLEAEEKRKQEFKIWQESRRAAEEIRKQKTQELSEFIYENREALEKLFGQRLITNYKSTIEITLNKEKLAAILEKVGK